MATNSYRYAFASSTSQLPTSGTTVNLAVGEIGIFDAATWQATTAPSVLNKAIVIAQGTDNLKFPPGAGFGTQTPKTGEIEALNVKSWRAVKAQPGKSEVWTIGYDGVDTTKNLTVPAGATNFTFWLTLTGQPMANLLGDTPETHTASYTEQFSVDLPCVDDCSDNCGALVDPNVVADAAIDAIRDRKIIGGQFITDYIKVTKLVSCETPSGVATTSYTTYNLSVQDTGDNFALAQVQAQYPGTTVKRKSYTGVTSVYEITRITTAGTPSVFTASGINPLIPNCTTCPSGSTLVPVTYLYTVKRKDNGTGANLTTIKSDYSDTNAIRLSYDGVTSIYEIHNTTGVTPTAIAGDLVGTAGSLQNVCVLNNSSTIAWSSVATCTRASETYYLTIKNTDCGGTYLTQLQAQYSGVGTVALVTTNTGTCTSQYSIVVQSDNVACDTCDIEDYIFTAPQSFLGLDWTPSTQTFYGQNCVVGLKFESIYEQRKAQECFLKSVPFEFEPLFIVPSTRNPDPNDYSVICAPQVPTTKISPVQYEQGFGRVVADAVIDSNFNFNNFWRKNPAERDAFGYQLGIQLNGYYDQYTLTFLAPIEEARGLSGLANSLFNQYEWTFYYPQGEGVAFAQAINGWLLSSGSKIAPVNV